MHARTHSCTHAHPRTRKQWSKRGAAREAPACAPGQGRRCEVAAFSSAADVVQCGALDPSPAGVARLVDFLSHGFHGGTDVTGALVFALQRLDAGAGGAAPHGVAARTGHARDSDDSDAAGAGAGGAGGGEGLDDADVVLVSDGELQVQPVGASRLPVGARRL